MFQNVERSRVKGIRVKGRKCPSGFFAVPLVFFTILFLSYIRTEVQKVIHHKTSSRV
jgi:hypothetical protein